MRLAGCGLAVLLGFEAKGFGRRPHYAGFEQAKTILCVWLGARSRLMRLADKAQALVIKFDIL